MSQRGEFDTAFSVMSRFYRNKNLPNTEIVIVRLTLNGEIILNTAIYEEFIRNESLYICEFNLLFRYKRRMLVIKECNLTKNESIYQRHHKVNRYQNAISV